MTDKNYIADFGSVEDVNAVIDVACRAKRKKLTRKMQKSRLKRLENDVPNGIFI